MLIGTLCRCENSMSTTNPCSCDYQSPGEHFIGKGSKITFFLNCMEMVVEEKNELITSRQKSWKEVYVFTPGLLKISYG